MLRLSEVKYLEPYETLHDHSLFMPALASDSEHEVLAKASAGICVGIL